MAVENYIVSGNVNISSRVKFIHDVQVGVFALDRKVLSVDNLVNPIRTNL